MKFNKILRLVQQHWEAVGDRDFDYEERAGCFLNRFGHVRRQRTRDISARPISPLAAMSSTVSVQQILGEARRLVGRLREQDGNADRLLAQAQALNQGVEAMRQYHEELAQLSCVAATPRPRAALVLSIQQENRHMRELQQENRELVAALKEHQSALELIMAKYREQVARLGSVCQAEQRLGEGSQDCHHLADKICEMAEVMRRAAEIDELSGARQTETLVRLSTENAVLRQLLDIGRRAGSAGLADVEVQTDSGSVASPE
ncbi:hypothetical protein MTO96_039931 [Rhipicephalus appendiculatus]